MPDDKWTVEGEGESSVYRWNEFEIRPSNDEYGLPFWQVSHRGNVIGGRPNLENAMDYCKAFTERLE